ncbi:MAG: phage tail sheath C-terminal domain-containing protein [Chitinivibrionales bacterium]|nr:phage tail sheath C-terminal domain-containing protein [Chitinivibrionales bacterium]
MSKLQAAAIAAVMAYEEDPARPLNTLALTGIAAPPIASRLSRTEQESCLSNGVTPLEVGPGEIVQIVRAISTYVQDAQGIDDVSLLDITTMRTLDYVRKAIRTRVALRFPREKLSSKTPDKVRDQIMDVLYQLEDLEIVEEVAANEDGVICERDLQDPNRLDAKIPCDVVNGLHVFAGRIDLLL